MRSTQAACYVSLLLLTACGAGPQREGRAQEPVEEPVEEPVRERSLEFVHQPVTDCRDHGGVVAVGLGPMARWFAIHPELSPDAEAMAAFARRAMADGRRVYATIWIRENVDKARPDSGTLDHPWVLVRLDDTPDPARG